MAAAIPSVLVLGHSFVKRLKRDLHSQFDPRAVRSFNLTGTATVHLRTYCGKASVVRPPRG